MSDPLGLSIGTTNLVAARVGNPPVTRRSVLPLAGQVLTGFVERVGDPVPVITDDGSSYRAESLLVEALDAMVTEAGGDPASPIAIAVPAHWNGGTLRALRDAMRDKPNLAPNGTPARLVSDAVASLTALGANPGLPERGVVALLDFGGGGTSITLADAEASFEPIETTRLEDFSGDQIDQALLAHVLDAVAGDVDPAGTASVGSLMRLREECRQAKEELSDSTVADVLVDLPGHQSTVRVTRDELEALMAAPLAGVLAKLDESLSRNRIAPADVSAVIAVGGGARIPLVTRELSGGDRSPLVTTPHPAFDAAVGAALFAAHGVDADATGLAPTALVTEAVVSGDAAPGSSTFRALAWSQDDDTLGEPEPYVGEDPYADPYGDSSTTRVVAQYHPRREEEPQRTWQRLPLLIFGVAATIAVVAVGGVAIALTSSSDETHPAPSKAPVTATSPPLPPSTSFVPPPPPPTTEAPQNVITVTSEAPPPPPPPPETVTVERRPATTTITTTQPTTTTPTTTTTTTTPPPITTTTTTSDTPTMTTSYITVPFVPIPIPIQVPATPTPTQYQPPYYQQPQYQQPQYQQPQYQQPQYGQQPQFPY